MDNSLKTKRKHPREGLRPSRKTKTKTILIDKQLKTNGLYHTAAVRASEPITKPNPKTGIVSAEGRVKPLARLLRCATALRVTPPLGYGSRRLKETGATPPFLCR